MLFFKRKRLTYGSRFNRAVRSLLGLMFMAVFWLSLVGGIGLFIYLIKVDKEVSPKFENRRWSLPARVYARPLELFKGAALSPDQVKEELNLLHYRETDKLSRPGSYRMSNNTLELYTRQFTFGDGVEPSRQLRLQFEQGQITDIQMLDTTVAPSLLRIEPAEIASIYPAHNEDRVLVKREQIPAVMVDALLAMEDRAFYQHHGVNPKAIARAMIANMMAGKTVQGGSTLTQQLIKNYFLTADKTYARKLEEMAMALVIDWRYSKDEILEAYANEIYLGQDGQRAIHGFGLASRYYFGRPLNELTLNHIATLIGLIPSPSKYNPRRNPDQALVRRNLVLDVMVTRNLLSAEDAETIKQLPLDTITQPPSGITQYPAFVDLVNRQLRQHYNPDDLGNEGLQIFTTFDPKIQAIAEQALVNTLPKLEKAVGQPAHILQGSLIIADTQTGEIQAIVGDRDVRQAGFNRALDARRQPGSLIKPIIYLRALEEPYRYNLATLLDDSRALSETTGDPRWNPNNYDRKFHGDVPLITALAKSYNIPTVRLGLDLGVEEVIQTLYRLGLDPVSNPLQPYPSLLLGSMEMTPMQVTQVYGTLANGGYRVPLRVIREVTSAEGQPLAHYGLEATQAIYPGPAYLIQRAMQQVVLAGTAGSIRSSIKTEGIAGKTGTTDDYRDSWFAGFTGNRIAVAWVGRDDNKSTRLSGSTGALKLWIEAMKQLPQEPLQPSMPPEVRMVSVDMATGLLSDGCSTQTMSLPFIQGSEPVLMSDCDSTPFFENQNDVPVDGDIPAESGNIPPSSVPSDYNPYHTEPRSRVDSFFQRSGQ